MGPKIALFGSSGRKGELDLFFALLNFWSTSRNL
jgi:hypothetical protein